MLSHQRFFLFVLLLSLAPLHFAFAQTWTKTSADTNINWLGITSSADGSFHVAGGDSFTNYIYTSSNSGNTWNVTPAPRGAWESIASSYDGRMLVAVSFSPGFIYTSTDYGASWVSNNVPFKGWSAVASSADGQKLFAVNTTEQHVYRSTNAGTNWSVATNVFTFTPANTIACSADGTKIITAGSEAGDVYRSTNGGLNWSRCTVTGQHFRGVASSADGNKLLLVSASLAYRSTNAGVNWSLIQIAPPGAFTGCASSADASKLVAVCSQTILTSTNSGASWTTGPVFNIGWGTATSSADGSKLLASHYKAVWISQTAPSPRLRSSLSPSDLRLSWIIPSAAFVLQSSPDLSPMNWTDVTNAPSVNLTNLEYEVTLPVSPGMSFFRLKTLQ